MREFITRIISLHYPYEDAAGQQQARRLLGVNLAWLIVVTLALPLSVIWSLEAGGVDTVTMFIPLTLLIAGLTHRLIQRGQLPRARMLFVVNILSASLLAIFPDYRIDTPFVLVLTLPITAAGALLRRPGLIGIAVLLVVAVTVGGLFQISTDMEPTPLGTSNTQRIRLTLLLFGTFVLLNTAMLAVFVRSLEDVLRQQRDLADLLSISAELSKTLSTRPAPGEALNQFVEQLRDLLNLYHIQIFLTEPATGQPTLRASTGYIGRRLLEEDSLATPDDDSPINDALRRKDLLVIERNAPEEQRSEFLPATQCELLLPLYVGEKFPFGVLDMHSANAGTFSPHMRHVLTVVSHQLSTALYSVEQGQALNDSYQEHDRLVAQIETGQRELARANRQLVGATWDTYLEERAETAPGFKWQGGEVIPATGDSSLLEQTLHTGDPYLGQADGQTVLCVPVRLRGQTLGALEFRRDGSAGWPESALELAQAVAERLALSLENARLFEEAQITAQREQLISEVTSRLQTSSDLQTLLSLAASQFQDALGATHTNVRLGLPQDESSESEA
jgi:GAF domain-containing protein